MLLILLHNQPMELFGLLEVLFHVVFSEVIYNLITLDPCNHILHDFSFYLGFFQLQLHVFEISSQFPHFFFTSSFGRLKVILITAKLVMLYLQLIDPLLCELPVFTHIIVSFPDDNKTMMGRYFLNIVDLFRLLLEFIQVPRGSEAKVIVSE